MEIRMESGFTGAGELLDIYTNEEQGCGCATTAEGI
jgi:hypothetical protein